TEQNPIKKHHRDSNSSNDEQRDSSNYNQNDSDNDNIDDDNDVFFFVDFIVKSNGRFND
ncbi:unnamed protein product, partial [Rotaria sp. Silwood1]